MELFYAEVGDIDGVHALLVTGESHDVATAAAVADDHLAGDAELSHIHMVGVLDRVVHEYLGLLASH